MPRGIYRARQIVFIGYFARSLSAYLRGIRPIVSEMKSFARLSHGAWLHASRTTCASLHSRFNSIPSSPGQSKVQSLRSITVNPPRRHLFPHVITPPIDITSQLRILPDSLRPRAMETEQTDKRTVLLRKRCSQQPTHQHQPLPVPLSPHLHTPAPKNGRVRRPAEEAITPDWTGTRRCHTACPCPSQLFFATAVKKHWVLYIYS